MADDDKIAEVKRLRQIEEIKNLRSQSPTTDEYANAGSDLLRSAGQTALEGVGAVSSAVDRFTGAPIRAAVGAYQNDQPVGEAFANQFLKPAATAPTGKELAAKAGLSEEEFNTPLVANPFSHKKFKTSTAGLVGGTAEAVLDPTLLIPGYGEAKVLEKGGQVLDRVAPRVAEGIGNFAKERAVKAGTGESIRGIKKIAKMEGKSASDVDRALANLRATGGRMLSEDAAGPPVVGWTSNARNVAQNSAAKKAFYGNQIGEVGKTVDQLTPFAIGGPDIAESIEAYGNTIPNVGKGTAVRNRVGQEAENFYKLGPQSFEETQKLRGQFPYERDSPDLLISNKDATNQINRIIGQKMDVAAQEAGKPVMNAEGVMVPRSEEDLAKLAQYPEAKQGYNVYKDITDAASDQTMRTMGRRMVSPSSHIVGVGGGIAASAHEGFKKGGIYGAGLAIANQVALSRGTAFSARAADAISKKVMASPQVYQKWLPALQKAAAGGNAALVATHRELLNNDPAYRARVLRSEEP